ncbi:MAG: hypothetical protein RR893_10115 [Clostridia bacterium]
MKRLLIGSAHGRIAAQILPAFGAMVAQLSVDGVPVLRMNEGMLGLGNVLSGGIPVLFPFAGRFGDNAARFGGADYHMPMHGFAKDSPFEVIEADAQHCALQLCATEQTMRAFYPFDFRLEMDYRAEPDGLSTTAIIENRSREPMPFALGYHPYLRASDPRACTLSLNKRDYFDYLNGGAHGTLDGAIDLSRAWDHVFFGADAVRATLENPIDRYRATFTCDDAFSVLTLCTTQPGALCVEPWQAPPNAKATPDAPPCQLLNPGCTARYAYKIALI